MATNSENKASHLQRLLRRIIYNQVNHFARLVSESWDDLSLFEIIADLFASIMAVVSGLLFGFTQSQEQRELYRLAFSYSFWILMFLVLGRLFWVTPYKIITEQDAKLEELRERFKPKFELACSKAIDLCATPKDAYDCRYFRVRVSTQCVDGIEQCCGNLERIEIDGLVVFEGDATVLPFSKPETRAEIPILMKPDIDHWLDVLVVKIHHFTERELTTIDYTTTPLPKRRDTVFIATKQPYTPPMNVSGQYAFAVTGEYILYISISGKGAKTEKTKLKFTWTGKANDSTIEEIK